MFEKQLDLLAIGDITTDAFIRLKEASVHCDVSKDNCQICMDFASKIPYELIMCTFTRIDDSRDFKKIPEIIASLITVISI